MNNGIDISAKNSRTKFNQVLLKKPLLKRASCSGWPLTLVLILLVLSTLSACSVPRVQTYQFYVFGTLLEIQIAESDLSAQSQAIAALNQDFQQMHQDWHAWKPGGELVTLNQALLSGEAFEVSDSLRDLILQSQRYAQQTQQLFNPAIGALIGLWGFHTDLMNPGPPPPDAEIQRLVAANPTLDDLVIEGSRVSSANSLVQLDFGAIGKGAAVDHAITRLREFGIENAIVNAGGDLRAIGSKFAKPWKIAVKHPQGSGVLASLPVTGDESVFTSGNYERYKKFDGVSYPHIIDPRTGWPVEHVASVTVLAENGSLADAAATALVIAGPSIAADIVNALGVSDFLLVVESGATYVTPGFLQRLSWEQRPETLFTVDLASGRAHAHGSEAHAPK